MGCCRSRRRWSPPISPGGAYGSEYLVDPQERLVLVFMVQELPNTARIGQRFPVLVYQALLEPRLRVHQVLAAVRPTR